MGNPSDSSDKTAAAVGHSGGVTAAAQREGLRGPAPVHLWNPPYCGEMDMEIRADGTWFHDGTPIGRPNMVRMFANILKFEGGRHYLVTPVEKIGIRVEDAPFIAVDVNFDQDAIRFTTNIGDEVRLDGDHRLMITGGSANPRPYIDVRGGLLARIDRKSFYRLAEAATPGPDGRFGVTSAGEFFLLEC